MFGADGFYRTNRPEDHFRTAVTSGTQILDLVTDYVTDVLGHHDHVWVHDFGAGSGQLLHDLHLRARDRGFANRISLRGFDLRTRPSELDPSIAWTRVDLRRALCDLPRITGVAIAHELLDDVPCPILEVGADGQPQVIMAVDDEPVASQAPTGIEATTWADWRTWAAAWWPMDRPLMRCEVGLPREHLWRAIVDHVTVGWALAVDYGHTKEERVVGTWDAGTCIGYRNGRAVAPRTDRRRNLTAHVAMDALAASTSDAGTLYPLVPSASMPPGMYLLAVPRSLP